jgi:hypothetical protein
MMSASRNHVVKLVAAAFAVMLVFASVAAAEITKDEYKAKVEPICKTNKTASDKYLKDVRSLVKKDKLKKAGENFGKAAAALEKTQKQLAAVEQPPADAAKLTKWLKGIKEEVALMKTISTNLKKNTKAGKTKATSLVVKLEKNATTTNNQVISFAFNYCRIDPSKYA